MSRVNSGEGEQPAHLEGPPERGARYPFEALLAAARAGQRRIEVEGLSLDLFAYVAAALGAALARPIEIITPQPGEARRLAADLRFFAPPSARVDAPTPILADPYGHLSPDRGAVRAWMGVLARWAWGDTAAFTVFDAASTLRRVVPAGIIVERSALIARHSALDREALLRALADGGYHAVSVVEDPGTFAVRGGVIDVFPATEARPLRIELWGDEVESIDAFDPETQRRQGSPRRELIIAPAREELLIEPYREQAEAALRDAGAEVGLPTRKLSPMINDLRAGIPFMGVEALRPAFYQGLSSLDEALPSQRLTLIYDPLAVGEQIGAYWEALTRGRAEALEAGRPSLPPEAHALSPAAWRARLEGRTLIQAHTLTVVDELGVVEGAQDRAALRFEVPNHQDLIHELSLRRGESSPLEPLLRRARDWVEGGARVLIVSPQRAQLERLGRLLRGYGVPVAEGGEGGALKALRPPAVGEAGVVLLEGHVSGGFRLLDHGLALITEGEIFGAKAPPRRRAARQDEANPFIQSFRELEPGDHVVHADHGIGIYEGLKKLIIGGAESDFLIIHFAGKDTLYLPVYKLGRLQKYIGGANPRVDKLGGVTWQKTRSRAKANAEEDAYALLGLYAQRRTVEGYAFSPPDDDFRAFEGTFPFEETPDQARAIEEVLEDMARPIPMDRLLCGDVGFGKTEVALRAAMKAALDGKQVAVLVPTTVLALQHFQTFEARFKPYPLRVALLSRLITQEASRQLFKDIKTGRVDILIGTHRILNQDLKFKDLGLLILDEEHRFGVKHKERLKEVRAQLDVLTMTATPIPRTLQLSVSGLRDLSMMTTPPHDRLSVRTFVCRATDAVVRDGITRELSRGGQVFFVHNRVHSIEARKSWLQSLVPSARIVVGHGQMEPAKLERVMLDFTQGRFNVLLTTTIIESGIDIPNANTIFIDQADHFGLAALYQLRGRVGRAKERGYCFLLVPSEATLNPEARKRLAVIQKFTDLGSGFQIAHHDMEIRGAGELLGTKQKGRALDVGLEMYAQMLEEAVRALRGQTPPPSFDPDLNLQVHAVLDEAYIADTHLRLIFYKRLANCNDEEDVLVVAEEMEDRFGPLPGPAENLVELMRVRVLARYIGLKSVDLKADGLHLIFDPRTPTPVEGIVRLITTPGARFTAPGDLQLRYTFNAQERAARMEGARMCLQRLAELINERS
ncbi:transcription-repair coupling factor [Myxococcota bacterium]|nr:transcription-repair coupling factor [Myxococcota bacterium]